MAVWSEVALSEVELTRIDAEFYRPDYLAAKKAAGSRKLKAYGAAVLHPAEFTRRYTEVGHFVLLAQNNRDNRYDWSTKQRVAPGLLSLISRNRLEFGDVTITRSGANCGQASVIGIELENEPVYACADLLILRSESVDGHLISTYLNSSVGRLLLDRGAYGAAQPHIAPSYIKEIPFPATLLSIELEVRQLIIDSRKFAMESDVQLAGAQQILESALGLNKLTFQKPVGYVAQLSNIEVSRRFDPEHFFPAFSAFCASLPSSVALDPLSKHLQFCQRGKQPVYAKTGLAVINSKHVQPNRVIREGNRFALANPVDDLQIRSGDTLINGTGRGTIGRTAPYISDTPAVADNHVTILRSSSLDPAYLSLYLNSAAGQMQVEMHQRGTSGQLELYPFDIRKFLVWPAPGELQRDLRDLYDKATKAERESKRLLEQAKARVEQLIEAAVQP
ncbi:MAG TPA: hypothetical protein DHV85_01250 [Candidatus Accumulibacter sp.]|jgi:hypothetical protein|nr:hypothetical protein [Accumulibacter sp.]HCZ13228.1 hypothetical protein [Accumulibacter sp.]